MEKKHEATRSFEQRVREAMTIAHIFANMNDTKWNTFDDEFYIINRKWFDVWKQFISYDYVVQKLVHERRKISELSVN